jgi:hypothetical protein
MNQKVCKILALILPAFIFGFNNLYGQDIPKHIPVYITPVYNSDPLTIKVGKYSKELSTSDPQALLSTADKIKQNIDNVKIEA